MSQISNRGSVAGGWIRGVGAGLVGLLPGCVILVDFSASDSVGDDEAFEDEGDESTGFEDEGDESTGFESTGFEDEGDESTGFETMESSTGESSTGESETSGFEESDGYEGSESTDTDTGEPCEPPPLHPRNSLIETNPDALAGISMPKLLTASALGAGLTPDPQFTFIRLFDSFTTDAGSVLPGGSYCDDKILDGLPSLNGYPIQCPRIESQQVETIEQWFPIAAVNRFDLAPLDGSHCGEQRIIMASNAGGRAFAIFEAQIPNPDPACGIAACEPLVQFWAALGQNPDPAARSAQLRMAFLDGHPDLDAAGFQPFMTSVNMTSDTGQIRTNSFDDDPWTLREFSFVTEGERLGVVPSPVANNAFGPLWNDLDPLAQGEACRQAILDGLPSLLVDDVAQMGLAMPPDCQAGESRDDENTDYAGWLSSGSGEFQASLAARLAELGSDLDPIELAKRAEFASNCMGCHESGTSEDLGHGLISPPSNGFVHVDESSLEGCGAGQTCFAISPALADEFLPHRRQVMIDFLDALDCERRCGDGSEPLESMLASEADHEVGLAAQTLGGRPRGSH